MTKAVIDVLEATKIKKKHSKPLPGFPFCINQGLYAINQRVAIGQLGQRVIKCHPLDMLLPLLALSDVEIGRTHTHLLPLFVIDRCTDMLEPNHLVVPA